MHVVESTWTTVRIDDLKRMWSDGNSATEIAASLGLITRSAVLGKVHRLGLEPRRTAYSMPARPKRPTVTLDDIQVETMLRRRQEKARQQRERYALVRGQAIVERPPEPAPVPLECRPCSLLELTSNTCRFPIGDPGEPDFHFCGAQPQGRSYCGFHNRLTHTPAPKRTRPFIQARWNPA